MPSLRRRSARTGRGSSPASDDQTAKVWDARSGAEVLTLKGHTDGVSSASFSPDGSRIVTGSRRQDGEGLGRARAAPRSSRSRGTPDAVSSASFSPDGSRIVTGEWGQDGEGLGRAERCRGPHAQGAHRSRHFGVVQPRRVAGRHRRVRTRRRRSGTPGAVPRSSRSRGTPIASVRRRSAPTGRGSSPASDDETAKVWDAHERRRGPHAQGAHRWRHFGVVQPRRLAGRHRRVTTGRRRSGTRRSGAEVLTLKGHTDAVNSASFSPDGSRVVTGSGDQTAKVWDAKSGAEVLTLKGHTGAVCSASFSPDGSRIVTGE